jgi:hypothetical protein
MYNDPDVFKKLRQIFTTEDRLTAEQGAVIYSDSKLAAVQLADPATFERWVEASKKISFLIPPATKRPANIR